MKFTDFKRAVSDLFSIDLNGYKEGQLKRRIEHLMLNQGYHSFDAYYLALSREKRQQEIFLDRFTINVSEFFRNQKAFETLEKNILSKLVSKKERLKIWSAACANGAEPYSIAIILDELTPGKTHTIDATDIDRKILQEAKTGIYKSNQVKNVSPDRLKNYFTKNKDSWAIVPGIKKRVNFRYHDLLKDNYRHGYDIIICRNVVIYFTRETQERIYKNFFQSLNPGGIIFIGVTESILNYRELGFSSVYPWFYKKEANFFKEKVL